MSRAQASSDDFGTPSIPERERVLSEYRESPYKPAREPSDEPRGIGHPHPEECCQRCGVTLSKAYRRVMSEPEHGLVWACQDCTSTAYLPWACTIPHFQEADYEPRLPR